MNHMVSKLLGHSALIGTLRRLLLTGMLLIPIVVYFGESFVRVMLPIFGMVFEWIADDFQLLQLTIESEGADRVLRATIMWKHAVFLGGHVIDSDPQGTASASTLLAHALQGPLAALITACAWPPVRMAGLFGSRCAWIELGLRMLVLLPLLAILVGIDMPVVLAGEIWHFVLDALAPQTNSSLVAWKHFMQGGGRYALGFGVAIFSVHVGQMLVVRK